MTEKLGAWIGVFSSTITIVLTILNYQLNSDLQKAEIALDTAKTELQAKAHLLEVSREKTERYQFVTDLLPDLLAEDESKVILTTNLIRLALTEDEADELFAGFASSTDKKVQQVGETAIKSITSKRSKVQEALDFERQGFAALLEGDFEAAAAAFKNAENAYPTFHQAYEIGRLLQRNMKQLAAGNVQAQNEVFRRIVEDLSWQAPERFILELRNHITR